MLKSPSVSKQQGRWWGFRPQEESFNSWLPPITFPNSFSHLLEQLNLSASCPGRFLCRNWLELLNPGSEWFHGYCKYHRWDAGLFNANVSLVNDLLRSGFHLCLHICWTFFWWYSEGGKEFDCLSEMVLNGSQTDPVLHLDSLSQGTIWNKTPEKLFFFKLKSEVLKALTFYCFIWEKGWQLHVFSVEASYQILNTLQYIGTAIGNNAVIIKGMLQGIMDWYFQITV